MLLQALKIFSLAAFIPILFCALGASFLASDIAGMNPLAWTIQAKIITLAWIALVMISVLSAVIDAQLINK